MTQPSPPSTAIAAAPMRIGANENADAPGGGGASVCCGAVAGQVFGWQKDFYDHHIRANEDYGAQVRYVLRNPVRRGLVAHWEHWPHRGVLGQTWEQLALNIGTL